MIKKQATNIVKENTIHASVIRAVEKHMKKARFQRRTLKPEKLADPYSKSKCTKFGVWGHWADDHNRDGSLKPGVKSTHNPASVFSK